MMKKILAIAALLQLFSASYAGGAEPMLQATVRGERVEGTPLFYSSSRMQMLLRDGRLLDFKKSEAKNVHRSSANFRGYSAAEMRAQLAKQFGPKVDVSGTGHYLIVHPKGEKRKWASHFEELYRDFVHYFSVRGFEPDEPRYPLVAVVWKTQAEFRKHAKETGTEIGKSVRGYYSQQSNRIHLYDHASGKTEGAGWQQNENTIIHEVTHQTAYNTGVHTRFADTPLWVVEGLGTLFEAPGVYNSQGFAKRSDRVNRSRLHDFRYYEAERETGFLESLIRSNRAFETDPLAAYCQAWALTFYLVETQPRRYSEYLALVAGRKAGHVYSAKARIADFVKVFGENFKMHEARCSRFLSEIK